ncbi:MAG: hypothetical protein FJ267_17095, partial [Planctomycetes bacterium]|nr:hypothetical protein [Planctomycetota bacterium]
MIEQLARSFHRLHLCNIVFGDASANNILIENDHRVRFIDLAGAKDLIKGHGRSRDSINLVTPGFFAQTNSDSAAMKQVRTNLASDLYAVSANAFLILTGKTEDQCRSDGSRNGYEEWNRALTSAGVPKGMCDIVLKGLRVPDPTKSNDPTLYASAEALANDVTNWRQRRRQWKALLAYGIPSIVCIAMIAIFALVGWSKYEAERTAFEKRWLEKLQEDVDGLHNVTQPAIQKMKRDVDDLRPVYEKLLRDQGQGKAKTTLQQMTQILERAIDTSASLDHLLEWRLTLGQELIARSEKNDEAIIPWLTDCPSIQSRLANLVKRNESIKVQLDLGQTKEAHTALVLLQKDILKLKRDNDRAMTVKEIQNRYDTLRASLPERLRTNSEFKTIDT